MRLSCTVTGCELPVDGRGYCKQHYYRWRRYGDPLAPVLRRGPIGPNSSCRVKTCDRKVHARDLCSMHHRRALKGSSLDVPARVIAPERGCYVDSCSKPHAAKGLCRTHYYSYHKHGSVIAPGERQGWLDRKGYRCFRINGREYKEHRLMMEKLLGRLLLSTENVHHLNGQKADNHTDGPLVNFRSGNLELWSKSQPSGQRVTDKIAWAVELLELYAPELLAGKPVQLRLIT